MNKQLLICESYENKSWGILKTWMVIYWKLLFRQNGASYKYFGVTCSSSEHFLTVNVNRTGIEVQHDKLLHLIEYTIEPIISYGSEMWG